MQVQVGGSPIYIVDKKLGKGGFGQVYCGKRAQATKEKDGANANMVSGQQHQLTSSGSLPGACMCQPLIARSPCPVLLVLTWPGNRLDPFCRR